MVEVAFGLVRLPPDVQPRIDAGTLAARSIATLWRTFH